MTVDLKKIVFFDLETASYYKTLDEFRLSDPNLFKLWQKRSEYLRDRFDENKNLSDEELYQQKAGLSPEFSRIICASFGRVESSNQVDSELKLAMKSYSGDIEREILDGIFQVFNKFKGFKFCGHNVKRFDVPMMCKRLIINGFSLPTELQIQDKKPWEIPFLDTSELWSFGAWQESFTSLELLCTVLGIESSKEEINGSQVNSAYWNGKLDEITKYCESDVYASAKCFMKFNNIPDVPHHYSK
jgi:hypothetical protein